MKIEPRIISAILVVPLMMLSAQSPEGKSPDLKPTEMQQLKLQNAQLKAQLEMQNVTLAQAAYNQAVIALFQLCDEVKKENNWDKGVRCDPNTLKFSPPAKAADVGKSEEPKANSQEPKK